MNKSEMVYEQKKLIAELIGCECFEAETECNVADYDESIAEINGMINYYIANGDEREVAEWRKMLQQVKVEKRRAKKMIENKNRMEIAYT